MSGILEFYFCLLNWKHTCLFLVSKKNTNGILAYNSVLHLLCLQNLSIMQKMSYFFPLLFVCLDVCVVHAIRLAQLSPLLLAHPFVTLWGGGLIRACVLVLITLTYPGRLPWMSSFKGLQSLGVLCFHFPVYITVLWVLGQPTTEELWGWHNWERVGGCVLLVLMLLLKHGYTIWWFLKLVSRTCWSPLL